MCENFSNVIVIALSLQKKHITSHATSSGLTCYVYVCIYIILNALLFNGFLKLSSLWHVPRNKFFHFQSELYFLLVTSIVLRVQLEKKTSGHSYLTLTFISPIFRNACKLVNLLSCKNKSRSSYLDLFPEKYSEIQDKVGFYLVMMKMSQDLILDYHTVKITHCGVSTFQLVYA